MDTPEIYVACLAAYNSSIIHGRWISATEGTERIYKSIKDMLAESPIENSEEWVLHDYSGFGDIEFNEYENVERIAGIADFIAEHGELGAALLGDFSVDDAQTLLEDNYHGAYDSEVDFAQSIFEECYGDAIPKNLIYYIDREAFSRDLFMSDYFSMEAQGRTHVFSHC